MKRIVLFLLMNALVMVSIGILVSITGASGYLRQNGIDLSLLFVMSLIMGFSGSLISLFMSKSLAKWSTRARVIEAPRTEEERWLVSTVEALSKSAGISCPDVAIYESGDLNAFATGTTRNSALVAVSSGLLSAMPRPELKAVLAHEISHVANGDMVTMALLQGVLNTFVFFLSRVVAFVLEAALRRHGETRNEATSGVYGIAVFLMDLLFGFLASMLSMWFSRKREFAADAGASALLGSPKDMVMALRRLSENVLPALPKSLMSAGISGTMSGLFSTHPPIAERIEALEKTGKR